MNNKATKMNTETKNEIRQRIKAVTGLDIGEFDTDHFITPDRGDSNEVVERYGCPGPYSVSYTVPSPKILIGKVPANILGTAIPIVARRIGWVFILN